ncbi:MAG: regulatory protein RecX [Victivallaceae bacterium]|nr:regulatory protein RecX [Victivallaceae bacterium]
MTCKGADKPRLPVLEQALKYLGVRLHSARELKNKLRRKGYSEAESTEAVDECIRLHFVDDAQLREDYAAELARGNASNRAIRRKLAESGLGGSALPENVPDNEYERAHALGEVKLRTLLHEHDPRKKSEKLLRALLSRGFSLSTALQVRNALLCNDAAEPEH